MRLWKPRHTQDDSPRDPEITRWFQALGPPPVGQTPPDLHTKVLARIEQKRARHGALAWGLFGGSPAWAAALAMVLIVSLGFNVWWGFLRFGPRPPDDIDRAGRLRTYYFQAGMARPKEVGTVVAAHPASWDPTTIAAFTPQTARTTFFQMGTFYADALAALRGGAVEAAEQRLDILRQALVHVQATPALPQYLHGLQMWLRQQQYDSEVLVRFLALFEPLYEDAYVKADIAEEAILFRAGAWLESISLAAATNDRAALNQGAEMVAEVRRSLALLRPSSEVLVALERLHQLVARQALTDPDVQAIRALVQDIQRMLSE